MAANSIATLIVIHLFEVATSESLIMANNSQLIDDHYYNIDMLHRSPVEWAGGGGRGGGKKPRGPCPSRIQYASAAYMITYS